MRSTSPHRPRFTRPRYSRKAAITSTAPGTGAGPGPRTAIGPTAVWLAVKSYPADRGRWP